MSFHHRVVFLARERVMNKHLREIRSLQTQSTASLSNAFAYPDIKGRSQGCQSMDVTAYQCYRCDRPYDGHNRRPMLGNCGHTLCSVCRSDTIPILTCPFCHTAGAFSDALVNNIVFQTRNYENGQVVAHLTVMLDGDILNKLMRILSPRGNWNTFEEIWAELRSRLGDLQDLVGYARQLVRTSNAVQSCPQVQAIEGGCEVASFQGEQLGFSLPVALNNLSATNARKLLEAVTEFPGARRFARMIASSPVCLTAVGLSAVYLTVNTCMSILDWYNGDMTGEDVCRIFVCDVAMIGGGALGAMGGAAIGSLAGPVGTVFGGLAGGVVVGLAARQLANWLLVVLFQQKNEVALANAYHHLEVDSSASNGAINDAFRRLCFEQNPETPDGSEDQFQRTQGAMAVITAARSGRVVSQFE